MANEIGSFVVSIKAQIEGYQEQIAAIKEKLAEVGKDTDIGKEISKSLTLGRFNFILGSNFNVQQLSYVRPRLIVPDASFLSHFTSSCFFDLIREQADPTFNDVES